VRFGLGIAGSLSGLTLRLDFQRLEPGLWLPRRVEALASGRAAVLRRFRLRDVTTFGGFARFQVESTEELAPPPVP
jgi:hypothetical protein